MVGPNFGGTTLANRLVESLYTEAMLLADETRSYFDTMGQGDRDALSPRLRVEFACEALKGTTRLMQVIAWLILRKALNAGELPESAGLAENRRLGPAPALDTAALIHMPETARRLLMSGDDLYQRVRRLDEGIEVPPANEIGPARSLLQRLEQSL